MPRRCGCHRGSTPTSISRANPDVAEVGTGPVHHFLRYGRLEARPFRPEMSDDEQVIRFDPEAYWRANPDTARLGLDPLEHFQRSGQHKRDYYAHTRRRELTNPRYNSNGNCRVSRPSEPISSCMMVK
jgi:hypothetical protein